MGAEDGVLTSALLVQCRCCITFRRGARAVIRRTENLSARIRAGIHVYIYIYVRARKRVTKLIPIIKVSRTGRCCSVVSTLIAGGGTRFVFTHKKKPRGMF